MPSEYLTVAEVAARIRVTTTTVRAWIHAGRLPAAKVGLGKGQWLVTAADLGAFLVACRSSGR